MRLLSALVALLLLAPATLSAQTANDALVIDDFEDDPVGKPPAGWIYVSKSGDEMPIERILEEGEQMTIRSEDGNRFAHAATQDEALRISKPNGTGYTWNTNRHPRLRWRWRAHELPEGASERGDLNDTGGAVYVTFDTDWLGRPKSIKYTYSSTLPMGTVVSFGRLKVIVAASGLDELGGWRTVERDVVADYRRLFGDDPPREPLSITLWSDSDDTGGTARVDFDDFMLLP